MSNVTEDNVPSNCEIKGHRKVVAFLLQVCLVLLSNDNEHGYALRIDSHKSITWVPSFVKYPKLSQAVNKQGR